MSNTFDLIIVGGGPGGYVAAIRAAQLGKKVALVEKNSSLGGTCLNVGCIPSKALLDSSELYHLAQKKFSVHGIELENLKVNLPKMMERKNQVVENTVKGIDYLMKKNKIERFTAIGSMVDPHTVKCQGEDKETLLQGKHIILATGSEPTPLPFAPFDGKRIISSTEALCLPKVPENLLVVGGGVIGLELGSVYARLGTKVTVIEFLDSIIPTMDRELGKALQKSLKKIGFTFHLSTKVTSIEGKDNFVQITAENKAGEKLSFSGDYALVSIGRRPYTKSLNLEAVGVNLDKQGRIVVNEHLQTSQPHIYAIGDVVTGPMLAHKAEEEGVSVAERIAGKKPHLNYNTIPGVVYTWPEVASVGKTEEELKDAGISYKTGNFPFKASGRARAAEDTDGFIKVLADSKTDEILGVHMIGPRCADLITEAVVAMEYRASAEDIGMIVHPHPTFSESFKEAALMATGNRALHL